MTMSLPAVQLLFFMLALQAIALGIAGTFAWRHFKVRKVPLRIPKPGLWPPPPMPGVREARHYIIEAKSALERAERSWAPSELEDALRSTRYYVNRAQATCLALRWEGKEPPSHDLPTEPAPLQSEARATT